MLLMAKMFFYAVARQSSCSRLINARHSYAIDISRVRVRVRVNPKKGSFDRHLLFFEMLFIIISLGFDCIRSFFFLDKSYQEYLFN